MNYDGNIIDIVNSPTGNLPAGFAVNKFFNNGSEVSSGDELVGSTATASRRIQDPLPGITLLEISSRRWMFPTRWASTP